MIPKTVFWEYLFYMPVAHIEAIHFKTQVSCHPPAFPLWHCPLHWFPRAALPKHYKLGWLETETDSLMALEVRTLKSRCWQGPPLSEGSRQESVYVFLLVSGFCQQSLVLPGL